MFSEVATACSGFEDLEKKFRIIPGSHAKLYYPGTLVLGNTASVRNSTLHVVIIRKLTVCEFHLAHAVSDSFKPPS